MKTRRIPTTNLFMSMRNLLSILTLIALIAVVTVPVFSVASASLPRLSGVGAAGEKTLASSSIASSSTIIAPWSSRWSSSTLLYWLAPQSPSETVETFAADCTTPKTAFELGETICAKISGGPAFRRNLAIVNPGGYNVSQVTVTTDPQTLIYQLPSSPTSTFGNVTVDNRGKWRASSIETSDATTRIVAPFLVSDPTEPVADLSISKFALTNQVGSGGDAIFAISLLNKGPNAAVNVTITDAVPASTTFDSSVQTDGPEFTCATTGSTGTTTCTIASFPADAEAQFLFRYLVNSGVSAGTLITNTATVSSQTTDSRGSDNSSTSSISISATGGGGTETCSVACPENVVAPATTTDEEGNSGAIVHFAPASGNEECGAITADHCNDCFFPLGTTIVTATSATGDSCSFTVTVTQAAGGPTISCPTDKDVTAESGACDATVDPGTPTTTGDGVVVTGERSDGQALNAPYPGGTTSIVWTATDDQDRTATCEQLITVTVEDTTPPSITAPDDVVLTTGSNSEVCGLIVGETELGSATASDNCSTVNVSRSGVPPGNFFPVGTTTVTYTATDGSGNTASDTQTVTVTDDSPPTITATETNPNPPPADIDVPVQDVTVNTGPNSTSCDAVVSNADLGNVKVKDNCSGATLSRNPAGNTFPVGTTVITWTATDANGNTSTVLQNVTVIDDTVPTITAPSDVSVNTGPGSSSCEAQIDDATLGSPATADNCTVTVSRSPSGNTFPVGTTTITWTVTDASGNTATDTQDVTVVDNTAPSVTAPADSSAVADASCQAPVPDYAAGSTATDNCDSSVSVTQSPAAGTMVGVGPHTVTVTATDDAGNQSSDTVVFTVVDNTAPVISCPANISTNTDPNTCSANVNPGTATATDTCDSSPTITGTRSDGQPLNAPYPQGTTTITWTATDDSGNSSSCTQTVTVTDNQNPTIVLNGQTPILWPPNHNYHTFQVTDFVSSVTDNCGGISVGNVVITQVTSDESENGNGDGNTNNDIVIAANCKSLQLRAERQGSGNGRVYTILFSVKDGAGNTSTATAKVLVPKNANQTPVDSGPQYTVTGNCP
ncbi:MAG TPA: HYR domain-containing protein [Pyrinomonadaceae bacterium]|nr:HYR domain-containing protein [Pyrinomonadaceae bacterium]